jgi:hypothetical protein
MKTTTPRRKRPIQELHPRDVADAEYDEHLQDMGDMYSDMHKELYGRRPRIPMFKTIEEAEAAVDQIWTEYTAKNRAEEKMVQQDLGFQEIERRMQELMPGEYDIELPVKSGMGRRMETKMKITKRQLRRIIKEERLHIINENLDTAHDELTQAKDAILRQDKYFSDLTADFQSRGDDWLAQEAMDIVNQLRQASDLLDGVIANVSTIQRNS